MSVFTRLFRKPANSAPAATLRIARSHGSAAPTGKGTMTLEVVGESFYQENLWQIVGSGYSPRDRVRFDTLAVLVPEPDNPHDPNAVKVLIDQLQVGHLSRDTAAEYRPGLLKLMRASKDGVVSLDATIIGWADADSALGVFLQHEPADFGVISRPHKDSYRQDAGSLRTGRSEAAMTDAADDTYDLSWSNTLTGNDTRDIPSLRKLLRSERDPIDRHYMLTYLGACLYRSRDVFTSALEEFDAVCEAHHDEMAVIRPALLRKFDGVPLIEMYKQASIRCKKAHDYPRMLEWAERGLVIYGDSAARPEDVADLQDRARRAKEKIAFVSGGSKIARPRRSAAVLGAGKTAPPVIEVLACVRCAGTFERVRVRGRKPHLCPSCRSIAAAIHP